MDPSLPSIYNNTQDRKQYYIHPTIKPCHDKYQRERDGDGDGDGNGMQWNGMDSLSSVLREWERKHQIDPNTHDC